MKSQTLHDWSLTPREAVALQNELAKSVEDFGIISSVRYIAGADISVARGSRTVRAAVVVLEYPGLDVVEVVSRETEVSFPYVPGLLSFREAPPVIELCRELVHSPQILIVDGHGVSHPRRFGIASHIGLWLDIPTIGCAKSRLCGEHAEVGPETGDAVALVYNGEIVGTVLRSRSGTKPLYISAGHKIGLKSAVYWITACMKGYRLPEPSRLAHMAAGGKLAEHNCCLQRC